MTRFQGFEMSQRSLATPFGELAARVDQKAGRPSIGRWIFYFVAGAVAFMAFCLLVLWASNGFQSLGIGTAGLIGLILGSLLTTALGIALMGLVFYSDRSGTDEFVYRTSDTKGAGREE